MGRAAFLWRLFGIVIAMVGIIQTKDSSVGFRNKVYNISNTIMIRQLSDLQLLPTFFGKFLKDVLAMNVVHICQVPNRVSHSSLLLPSV